MKQDTCSRREFISTVTKSAAAIAVLAPVLGSDVLGMARSVPLSNGPVTLDLTDDNVKTLTGVGGAIKIPNTFEGGKPIIVVRTSETTVAAYSSKCTHWGCELPLPGKDGMTCHCHGAKFSSEGKVLAGPAKKDLKIYPAVLKGNLISISNVSGN
jgi:Rieske Fe-S protein